MRIVAGTAKGRALVGPKDTSKHIRPTADRVRETIFNILGQVFEGESVLDLYAGTGALALESLSRGAARAVLVDQDREALALCRTNAEALGFLDRVEILAQPVGRTAMTLRGRAFDLVFADPPYASRMVASVLELVEAGALLAAGGVLIVEHDKREEAPEALGAFTRTDQRKFGDTLVSFFRIA